MPQAPEGTIFHIGKTRKEVSIKNAPEELLSRLMYCKSLDEAIAKEYNIKRTIRLTRENINDIAKKLGIEVEITNLMGAGAETLSLRMLDRKGVKLIVSEDIEREDFNLMDIYYKQFTHITGAGMFTGGDLKPEGVLMAEECFLLLG